MAVLIALALVFSTALAQPGLLAQASSPAGTALEYQVKAAYIINFISLTEWPADALGLPSSPLHICVAGNDPFRGALEGTARGETVRGHPLVVERLSVGDDGRQCHVLFVSGADDGRFEELLRSLSSLPSLTIGETEAFLRSGGIVSFAVDQGHVRFDVNRRAAEQRGLTLSSRLLRVARSVR